MKFRIVLGMLAIAGFVLPACSTDEASQTDDHTEGALGFAPTIKFGDTVTGQVSAPQIDVWSIDVRAGDQFRVSNTTTSGDLRPDIVLFQGSASNHIRSVNYNANGTTLTKDYAPDHNGRYFVVVRGYQGEGSGSYELTATCTGGSCAGEVVPPPLVELEEGEKAECVRKTRECAVDALPDFNGNVGAVRAQQVWDACLGKTTVQTSHNDVPASCAKACTGEQEEARVCQDVVGELPWLADATPACIGEFNSCVDDCYDAGDWEAHDKVDGGGEDVCVGGYAALNGSCGNVKELEVCGGKWGNDSCEACYLECHYTFGAWADALYDYCDQTCGNCELSEDF